MKPVKNSYSFHPACLAFPLMSEAELHELAEDIRQRGQLHPWQPPNGPGRACAAWPGVPARFGQLEAALVVDCHAGGGAFLAAAKATHRRWLATERDEATAVLARERLAGVPRKPGTGK